MQGKLELLKPLGDIRSRDEYYILIEGSESYPDCWRNIVDHPDLESALANAREGVISAILGHVDDFDIYCFKLVDLRAELTALAHKVREHYPGSVIVTLSEVYCDSHDEKLEINRMIATNNEAFPNAGPRPYAPLLSEQISSILDRTGGKPVILVDDVSFDGATTLTLNELGLPVSDVVCGVVTSRARAKLNTTRVKMFDPITSSGMSVVGSQRRIRVHNLIRTWSKPELEEGYKSQYTYPPFMVDTCPIHDFIPFAPLSGKTVGYQARNEVAPWTIEGISFSKPYVIPYYDAEGFSSASGFPKEKGVVLSGEFIQNAISLFSNLSRMAGRDLTIADLADRVPRISYPLPNGHRFNFDLNEPIVEVLKKDLDLLKEVGDEW